MTAVDFSACVRRAVTACEERAALAKLTLCADIADGITVQGDSVKLDALCSILLDNAVKYGDTFVNVVFTRAQHGGKLVVTNDGCQVPAEHKDKLFERFYREDTSRTRDTGGSGLGLSTVKALCDRNKWRVSIDCVQGGNMTVTVEMN